MELIPRDTTPEAAQVQLDVYRRLSHNKKLELACMLSTSLREFSAAGVRLRHPEYSDEQVKLAVIRLWLGEELFRMAYPNIDVAV